MVRRERGKVFDLRGIAALQRARDFLELAVAACRAAEHLGGGGSWVVDPDDHGFPVVTMRAGGDAVGQLVLGEVPRVHDTSLSVQLADTCVGLSLSRVSASTSCAATGL